VVQRRQYATFGVRVDPAKSYTGRSRDEQGSIASSLPQDAPATVNNFGVCLADDGYYTAPFHGREGCRSRARSGNGLEDWPPTN
jgi:hypothetical protein